jgi:PncC family amidohydrolase
MSDLAELAARVITDARRSRVTVATAESCTAGCLATLLADTPEAGEVFQGGFIVYSKQQKIVALGVSPDLIKAHTAVSREVAEAMAQGVLERCPVDLAIAITGVAGPVPDEDGNPVGLMHIAVTCRDQGIREVERQLEGNRSAIRASAMGAALLTAREWLGQISAPDRY